MLLLIVALRGLPPGRPGQPGDPAASGRLRDLAGPRGAVALVAGVLA